MFRLTSIENGDGAGWGRVGAIQVMGIKEYNCCDEHRVMDGGAESLYCTPEPNITLRVNYARI